MCVCVEQAGNLAPSGEVTTTTPLLLAITEGSDSSVQAKPKRKPQRRKMKNKLAETYPVYLQEAFFGKELLASKNAFVAVDSMRLSTLQPMLADDAAGAGSSESEKEDAPIVALKPVSLIRLSKEEVAVLDACVKPAPQPGLPPPSTPTAAPAAQAAAAPKLAAPGPPAALTTPLAAGLLPVGIRALGMPLARPPVMVIQRPVAPVGLMRPIGLVRPATGLRMPMVSGSQRPVLPVNPVLPVIPVVAQEAPAIAKVQVLGAELLLAAVRKSEDDCSKDLKDLMMMDDARAVVAGAAAVAASPKDELTDILSHHINLDTMVTESGLPNMDCKVCHYPFSIQLKFINRLVD